MENNRFSIFLIIIAILMAVISYAFLPAEIPLHFEGTGHASNFVPKWIGLPIVPAIMIFLHALRSSFKPEMIYIKAWRILFYLVQLVLVACQAYIIYFGLFKS